MASIQVRQRANRTVYAVLFRIGGRGGKQTSITWPTMAEAEKFQKLVNAVGGVRAMEIHGINDTEPASSSGQTVGEFLDEHIRNLTGLEKKTVTEYRRYLERDLAPLAAIPLTSLSRADVAAWVNSLEGSGKTISNKHGFLSGALKRAVKDGKIAGNPCEGMQLPRTERKEMVFLTHAEYHLLYDCFTEFYRPLVDFLVASGARFSEAAALRPADVNWTTGTVRISRAWKKTPGSWELGMPKTNRSIRTINVPLTVLKGLDRTNEWLFVNKAGKPVRVYGFRENVWYPTVRKAQGKGLDKKPRIHDLRHTCASWLIAEGIPLPAIRDHLGHESIKTTVDLYGHLDRKSGEANAAAIAAALARDAQA